MSEDQHLEAALRSGLGQLADSDVVPDSLVERLARIATASPASPAPSIRATKPRRSWLLPLAAAATTAAVVVTVTAFAVRDHHSASVSASTAVPSGSATPSRASERETSTPTPTPTPTLPRTLAPASVPSCDGTSAAVKTIHLGWINGESIGNPAPVPVALKVGQVVRIILTSGSMVATFDEPQGPGAADSTVLQKLCQTLGNTAISDFQARRVGTVFVVAEPRNCGCAMAPYDADVSVSP